MTPLRWTPAAARPQVTAFTFDLEGHRREVIHAFPSPGLKLTARLRPRWRASAPPATPRPTAAPSPTTSSPNAELGATAPSNADAAGVVAVAADRWRLQPASARPPPPRRTRRSSGSCAATPCTAQGRFEEALSEYYLSDRLVPNRNVEFNIARCLEKLRRFDEAFRAWSALDERACPRPSARSLRESIDRLRPQLALLRVDSEPPGAEIYLGRRDLGSLGQTPKLIAVPEGKATLVLDRDGHRPAEVPVEPQRGKEQVIAVKLERIFGRVPVTGIPETALVKRDSGAGELLRVGPGRGAVAARAIARCTSAPPASSRSGSSCGWRPTRW